MPALQTVEEYELAERILAQVITAERAADAVGLLPYSLGAQAELETRTGRWASASANVAQAIQLARDAGQAGQLSYTLARAARLEAATGRAEACREHAAHALVLARQHNFDSTLPFAESALGLLELGQSQLSAAILHLEETGRLCERIGLLEPGRLEWQADLVEAYVRDGQTPEALVVLEDLGARARACVRPAPEGRPATACTLAHAAVARCRGLLAAGPDVDLRFEEALAWHAWTRTPFEQARTELCYGEQLRRDGRRVAARHHLRASLESFEELGADPWAERARAELAATGETVATRRARRPLALTPQELQVALVVGGGATNREAAAALFLTPKTIEFHLAKIYRKLDLRSRTELARWVAAQEPSRA